jgi:ATP-dependent Clp protease ATP-binding subunit ClpB
MEELGSIVDLNVDKLTKRLDERRLTLGVTPKARLWLAEHGYDPAYGARPVRRLIQREIEDRLANLLLSGAATDGSFVKVDVDSGSAGLVLTATQAG